MSEMLGNQYFIARSYDKAARELEPALAKNPTSKIIRRKLIICFTETDRIEEAFGTFISLVDDDIDFIIDTDPIADDCPCEELVADGEIHGDAHLHGYNFRLKMAMLWLYCDLQKSIYNFLQVLEMAQDKAVITDILDKIKRAQIERQGNPYSQSSKTQ